MQTITKWLKRLLIEVASLFFFLLVILFLAVLYIKTRESKRATPYNKKWREDNPPSGRGGGFYS